MKPILSAVLLTLSLGLLACPGPTDPIPDAPDAGGGSTTCSSDADCSNGTRCCGGACIDVSNDSDNCGACGNTCTAANGSAVCTAGTCSVSMCESGHANCDGNVSNGCETNVSSDAEHCGACNHACATGETCNAGVCTEAYLYGFGGDNGGTTYSSQVWRFSLSQKQFELLPTQGMEEPLGRAGHVGAFDRQGNRMIIWGGASGFQSSTIDPDVWALDLGTQPATWTRIASGATSPGGRYVACSGYDSENRALYVFGGVDDEGTAHNDLWKLDLTTDSWSLIDDGTQVAPQPYVNGSCAYQTAEHRFVLFGGATNDADSAGNDLWVRKVDGSGGWANLALQSTPSPRIAAQFFDGSSPLALFGGLDMEAATETFTFPNDLTGLTDEMTWQGLREDGLEDSPVGRFGHAAAVLNGRYYVFGGLVIDFTNGLDYRSDLWEFDPVTNTWTELFPSGGLAPEGKSGLVMVAPR